MHEADDVYMGYAGKDELNAFLRDLLAEEQAGACVGGDIENVTNDRPLADLMRRMQQDQAHWCAVLVRHLKARRAEPKTGAIDSSALIAGDLRASAGWLKNNQVSVARKLREMLPRVRDAQLHKDLSGMLQSHEANIDRANDIDA
jgi:hypothetical protein